METPKRYAVLADIHGNVWALEAVLEDAFQRKVTAIINLGDLVYGPLQPKATIDVLRRYTVYTIQGNEDRALYEATEERIAANPTLKYVLKDLPRESLDWIRNLPKTLLLKEGLFLCHGIPDDDSRYLLEDVLSGTPQIRDDQDIVPLLNGVTAPVILCGHSHLPGVVTTSTRQLIINPGSVGLQAYNDDTPVFHKMETGSPYAMYAIIMKSASGWVIEHIKVPYLYQTAAGQSKINQRPDWEYALLTGRTK